MFKNLLSQSGLSMDRLAGFCEVADAGSIAAVAKGDPSRQSQLSRQIRDLEEFFGVELMRRAGRGLTLTPEGRELAALGREHFKALSDYTARMRGSEWRASIVASNTAIQWLLLPHLPELTRRHPDIHFELHHQQTREMVTGTREGTYDLGVVRKDALIPGLDHARIATMTYSLLIPKSLTPRKPSSLAKALESAPLALPIGGKLRSSLEATMEKAGKTLRVVLGCSSYLQAFHLLRDEQCAVALPGLALRELDLAEFHQLPITPPVHLVLAWTPRNAETRPALRHLIDSICEVVG